MAEEKKIYKNGVLMTLSVMGNKWKPLILCHLIDGPMRPADIRRTVEGISPKVLTEQLRQLERDGIIIRKVFNEVPPHVEYSITKYGESLTKVLGTMSKWGEERIGILDKQGENVELIFSDHEKYNN